MARVYVLLHILPLIEWGTEIGMMIVPFRYTQRKIFCFVYLKQTHTQQCRDETIGTISGNCHFDCDSGAIVFHWTGDTSYKCQSEHGTHSNGWVSRGIASDQLSLCASRTQLLRTNNGRIESKQSKGSCLLNNPFIWKMGQSQTRPTGVAPAGAMPPSPRTVCALRLAEPPHRFCCHYQHFSYPERAMSYSPPYSPSLFKRPDRR